MKSWFKKHRTNLILIGIVLLGMGLIAYPGFADWWNSLHQSRAVASYAESVANLDANKYSEMLADAEAYNAELAKIGAQWIITDEQMAKYESELAVTDSGIMGYIDIPKIRVTLPIYHGTDDTILQIAIGHIAGTSLPVGGASTHCVVSGHRGLPSARLFTDIDKLVEGDTFTMTVLNRSPVRLTESTRTGFLCADTGSPMRTVRRTSSRMLFRLNLFMWRL